METYSQIVEKLLGFTKKYYTKILVKGILLFLAFGLVFLLLILSVEYFLWLDSTGRFLLLLLALIVEGYLLTRFILIPLAYLTRLKKGISNKDASLIIGRHFPQVDDKLFNLLELAEDEQKTELLLASIDQRSDELKPVPFSSAVNLGDNVKYLKYLFIPMAIVLIYWVSGNLGSFLGSYERVVNYDMAYEPPAPFVFKVIAGDLRVLETEELPISVLTEGDIQPDEIRIVINDRAYLMQQTGERFNYTFTPPLTDSEFYFEANGYRTRIYSLRALEVPSIQDFRIRLKYPPYTGKRAETLSSTGNATFPEGTEVMWEIKGKNTERISLISEESELGFNAEDNLFTLEKTVYNDLNYQIATSNGNVEGYERLNYRFRVVKDDYPTIRVREVIDSLNANFRYYEGEASDDYELVSLKLICYPVKDKDNRQEILLDTPGKDFKQFYYTFPSGLLLSEGEVYEYFFEIRDNDGIRGGKSVKSKVYTTKILDDNELNNKQLDFQKSILEDMNRSLDGYKEQENKLEELNREQKEKANLSFNDQKKIKEFLNRQERQEEMMKRFSNQLKENLEKGDQDQEMNKLLQERLERQEIEARKNEKLLEELQKVADKLEKEELGKRLEELAKNQKNNERSLEQILELTKRYYVTEKASQLARDLEKLSEKQEALSKKTRDSLSSDKQREANEEFNKLEEEMEELLKDNKALKKPLSIKVDDKLKEDVKSEQKEALDKLKEDEMGDANDGDREQKDEVSPAQQNQRSAARKMKQMSEDLESSSSMAGSGSTIVEDAEMLRQILDNLITFSFKQELLFESLETGNLDISNFSGVVREQKDLEELFSHVDDSLFALSLRRAELSEFVNEQINEVYYNIDKSMESMVDGRIYQGVSYQQYVLTAANNLADFLANILDNMQQSMSSGSSSGGQGEDFQLPDIIKAQEELGEKMGSMSGKGKQGESGERQEGEGKESQEGEEGKERRTKEGNEGEDGSKAGEKGKGSQSESGRQGDGQEGEENLEELYEIYKEQERLKEMLEKQLEDMIRASDRQLAQKLIMQMEDFANELLQNGITERTMNKMNVIQHQLLKLENAALSQGEKEERKSRTNREIYQNPITTKPEGLDNFREDIEILNRQALPLQRNFQEKVKEYFDAKD